MEQVSFWAREKICDFFQRSTWARAVRARTARARSFVIDLCLTGSVILNSSILSKQLSSYQNSRCLISYFDVVSQYRVSILYLDVVSRYRISISYLDAVFRYSISMPYLDAVFRYHISISYLNIVSRYRISISYHYLDIVSRYRVTISYLDIVSRYRISIPYLDTVSRYCIPKPQFRANQEIFVILAWNLSRGKIYFSLATLNKPGKFPGVPGCSSTNAQCPAHCCLPSLYSSVTFHSCSNSVCISTHVTCRPHVLVFWVFKLNNMSAIALFESLL
jgi:hypothetical protein